MPAASYFCFVRTQTPVQLSGEFPLVRCSIIHLIIPRIQKTFIIKGLYRAVASRRMLSKRKKREDKQHKKKEERRKEEEIVSEVKISSR
jgi:hypothetical protein